MHQRSTGAADLNVERLLGGICGGLDDQADARWRVHPRAGEPDRVAGRHCGDQFELDQLVEAADRTDVDPQGRGTPGVHQLGRRQQADREVLHDDRHAHYTAGDVGVALVIGDAQIEALVARASTRRVAAQAPGTDR